MAAPEGIIWGNIAQGSSTSRQGRIGIYLTTTSYPTYVTVDVQIWSWMKVRVLDQTNGLYYDSGATTASTLVGGADINTTSNVHWDTANQQLIYETSHTFNKQTSAYTHHFAAMLSGIDYIGANLAMPVTASVTIDPLVSYTITYDANGGTGAPAAMTKWQGETVTISSTKPTRTNYTFLGWSTSASATVQDDAYDPGDLYSADANLTLYAVWKNHTYIVSYDANGGTGAPENQIKIHGENLQLSVVKPIRTNYIFKGWATTATGGVAYEAGGYYVTNASIKLYAVWAVDYTKPRLFNATVERCDSLGVLADDGTYGLAHFEWTSDYKATLIEVAWKLPSDTEWTTESTSVITSVNGSSTQLNAPYIYLDPDSGVQLDINSDGTAGTVEIIFGSGVLDTEHVYEVRITVSDSGGSTDTVISLAGMKFVIDLKAGGDGIAFGKPAELDDTVEFAFAAKFNGPVLGKALGMDVVTRIPAYSDLDDYLDPGCYAIYTTEDAEHVLNVPTESATGYAHAGRLEVWCSTGNGVTIGSWSYVRQRFIAYDRRYGTFERDIVRGTDNEWIYGEWLYTAPASVVIYSGKSNATISLSHVTTDFAYLEIFYTDNNGKLGGYTKLIPKASTDESAVIAVLSMTEASTSTTTMIRRTAYTISGSTLIPDLTNAGYTRLTNGSSVEHLSATTNFLYITKVVGHYV